MTRSPALAGALWPKPILHPRRGWLTGWVVGAWTAVAAVGVVQPAGAQASSSRSREVRPEAARFVGVLNARTAVVD
ncbi:MAG: hypothetical protein H7066_07785, partial [Cytophagaceae bacterium]|nr:hypothetical protein [Gemmatimonadaceae bacterium]